MEFNQKTRSYRASAPRVILLWVIVALLFCIASDCPLRMIPATPAMVFDLRMVPTVGDIIVQESLKAGISAHIPLAVAWRESHMNPLAISKTSDFGVMQLHITTLKALHIDPNFALDARINIVGGVGLLARYMRDCVSTKEALRAYATGQCITGSKRSKETQ